MPCLGCMRDRSSEERDSQQASGRGAGIGVLSLAETRREDPSSQLTHTEYADLQTVAPPMVGMTSQSTENTQRSSAVTTRSSRETSRPMKDQPSVAPLHSARQTDMSASGGDRSRSEEKPRRAVLTTSKAPPHTDDRSKITPPRLAKQPSTTAAEASAFKEKVQQRRQGASPASGVKQATADVNQSQQSRTTGPSGKHIQSGPSPPISPFEIHRYQLQDIPPRALVSPFTQDPRRTKGPGLTRRRAVPLRSLVTEHLASEATAESSKPASSQQNSSTSGQRSLRLGIETEFLLAAKFTQLKSSNLPNFVKLLAERHNAYIGRGLPLMDPSLRDYYYHYANDYSKWSMAIDESCDTLRSPWGIEMRTPILNAASGSSWRNVVAKTWEFLHRFYEITDNTACSTHVHISLNTGYSLTDLKRIACSVIHFETAFEALVPDSRHGNGYCKSNWLDGPDLARKGLSRPQSIDAIDAADNTYLVENLIQKPGDKSFAWNFDSLHQLGTIEFRKPPASITVEQALGWAELAMNFIQVSIEHGTPDKLKAFPSTIKGLRAYLSQVDVPGVNERYRMDWIWRGKDENGFRYVTHQRPGPHEGGKVMDNRLLDLNKADARRIMEHARSNGVPKSLRSIF